MKKALKIVTIGGGSSYTPELCEGLIKRFTTLPLKEWVLVDINENKKRTKIILNLIKRMFEKEKLSVKVWASYILNKKVLENTDYVTTQFRVGLQKARKKDVEITMQNNMLGQETNGIGGQFKAMRTIPVIEEIVSKVIKYCNGAWIINFTNPSGIITEYVNRYLKYPKFIGVCNIPIHTKIGVAKMMNLEFDKLKVDAAGLNHMVFFNQFYLNNKNITKSVLEKAIDPKHNESLTIKNITKENWNPTLIKAFGVLPCSYHKYYYKRGFMLQKNLYDFKTKKVSRPAIVMEIEKKLFKKYEDINLYHKPKELEERGGAYYSDVACGVIEAIHNNLDKEFVVNVLNGNKIENFDKNVTVEVTCRVNKNGAKKVARNISIPSHLLPLVQTIKQYELQIVKSIKSKSINNALLAAFINPLSEDDYSTEKTFYELMEAHKKYIKGWK